MTATARANGSGDDDRDEQREHRSTARPLPGTEPDVSGDELLALLEALLLAASEPATVGQLADATAIGRERVEGALARLAAEDRRGWQVVRHGDRVQLATAPRFAAQVRRFLGLERQARLTAASLETLAIVAYRQPVTRAEIEAVRGVDSAGVLSNLLGRDLIEVVGRLPALGNPLQYGTTPALLQHFGLASLDELPPLGAIDGVDAAALLDARAAVAEASGDAGQAADS
ncbi:MAG TPA: SMC-Scp complex subunit ScpB [Thermomicrobiales bacterium]|nr:SMC-Scp complex subunit ScpB [Thermomicrobiales bacterium]